MSSFHLNACTMFKDMNFAIKVHANAYFMKYIRFFMQVCVRYVSHIKFVSANQKCLIMPPTTLVLKEMM